jgi:hypothetical protein
MDVTKHFLRNKRGEKVYKVFTVTNTKPRKGIKFDTVNEIFTELLQTYKSNDIQITAKYLDDGFCTLKSLGYNTGHLKYVDNNYMKSVPEEIKSEILGKYYEIYFQITL